MKKLSEIIHESSGQWQTISTILFKKGKNLRSISDEDLLEILREHVIGGRIKYTRKNGEKREGTVTLFNQVDKDTFSVDYTNDRDKKHVYCPFNPRKTKIMFQPA